MTDKKECEKKYYTLLGNGCPHCGREYSEHSLYTCSKMCLDYLYSINDLKEKMGIKCRCNESQCGKCLTIGCQDDNCPTHTKERKEQARRRLKK